MLCALPAWNRNTVSSDVNLPKGGHPDLMYQKFISSQPYILCAFFWCQRTQFSYQAYYFQKENNCCLAIEKNMKEIGHVIWYVTNGYKWKWNFLLKLL